MKKIVALVKGKMNEVKLRNKIARVEKYLDMQVLVVESDIANANENIDSITSNLGNDNITIDSVINQISQQMDARKAAQAKLARIEEIRNYFNEEVTPEQIAEIAAEMGE